MKTMKMCDLTAIGARCQEFRKSAGYAQWCVARDTGYSIETISSFERGRNDNGIILLWYIAHGMTYDEIRGVEHGEK